MDNFLCKSALNLPIVQKIHDDYLIWADDFSKNYNFSRSYNAYLGLHGLTYKANEGYYIIDDNLWTYTILLKG